MDPLFNESSYILVSKKNFVRYAMPYEILPISMCCEVNNEKLFSKEILKALYSKELITDEQIVAEIKIEKLNEHISFSNIERIYFPNKESLDSFLERSYENNDVNSFETHLLTLDKQENNLILNIICPQLIDRKPFTQEMALKDSIVRCIYDNIKNNNLKNIYENIQKFNKLDLIIDYLFDNGSDASIEKELQVCFFKICSEFNISKGWSPIEVVAAFEKLINEDVKKSNEFQSWINTVNKIISGSSVNVVFDDNGNITLRAMTLVLLNPEKNNLENIKDNSNFRIGEKVYNLALTFVGARLGYSYLTAEEKKSVGDNRKIIRNIIAYIYNLNDELDHSGLVDNKNENQKVNILCQSWLKPIFENESEIVLSINGVKPMAGFSLNLIYDKGEQLLLNIIDRNSTKGMVKFKGQLALQIIELQKELPDYSRFEVNDKGLILVLPPLWINEKRIGEKLRELFEILKPLAITKKTSKVLDDILSL
ncbi:hypothetical protein [Acinetobacter indicus]|uniref:hypothetical protein n=1 Tax=Acinetobacter indicus TaxID=756892 RepID=UPI000CECC460|nr:hypothetical protein [Acinetobacter indicus]